MYMHKHLIPISLANSTTPSLPFDKENKILFPNIIFMFQRILSGLILFQLINSAEGMHTCGQRYLKSKGLVIDQQLPEQHHRLLIETMPHPLQLYGHFPTTTPNNFNPEPLRNIFAISASYFRKVIKVPDMGSQNTIYSSNEPCGEVQVPEKYRNSGFDSSLDLVVFINIVKRINETYVARATSCVRRRRPIYGQVTYNTEFLYPEAINTPRHFHNTVYITVHEVAHILGFAQSLLGTFYKGPTSRQKLGLVNTVRDIQGRNYIITPSVLAYVQHYFNCKDNITGALLQLNQINSTHWDRKVYYDETMTGSTLDSGLRMSYLTLLLLHDTGFYANVDITMAEFTHFGRGRGCDFARGFGMGEPEYCRSDGAVGCSFYSQSSGSCWVQMGVALIAGGDMNQCTDVKNRQQMTEGPSDKNSYLRYSEESRCIQTNALAPSCYVSKCVNNSVQIFVHNQSKLCPKPGALMRVGTQAVFCPKDFNAFCSYKVCPNYCSSNGLCVNGTCICTPPYTGIDCSVNCSGYFYEENASCIYECPKNMYYTSSKVCVKVCPSGYSPDSNKLCVSCQNTSCNKNPKIQMDPPITENSSVVIKMSPIIILPLVTLFAFFCTI